MFDMMSLSNDETERNNFFAQTLENSRVLIYIIFNEIQTSFSPCLSSPSLNHKAISFFAVSTESDP